MAKRSIRSICFGIAVFAIVMAALSTASFAQIGLVVRFGPPPLPVYEQPPCPEEGYLWTPGYWSFDNDYDDYYWVPGTWVAAPEPGYFWTPGYWGWGGNGFLFHDGYWGPRVGYYGGINYGYGYFGEGYQGGRWDNGRFFYNRTVNNVNVTVIRNVYETKVVENNRTRVSYNGGDGGINARPTSEDEAAEREHHIPRVAAQTQQMQQARNKPQLRASENHGKPPVAATARPGDFNDHAIPAKEAGGAYNPPANRGGARPNGNPGNAERPNGNPGDRNAEQPAANQPGARPDDNGNKPKTIYHPNDLPKRQAPSEADNNEQNKKYQQQMQKMQQKEDQQREKLQQKQDRDHQKLDQQKADDARKQQVEQRHEQQTQKLEQHEQKQEQKMQSKQPKPQGHPEQARPEPPSPQKDNQPH